MLDLSNKASSKHGTSSKSERRLKNWLESYMEFVQWTEPPISYHRWVGIGCISGAMQRRSSMIWGMERIHPNLYIVLLGPAAQTRKSTALKIGEDILKSLNLPMIGQDNSSAAIIRDIRGATDLIHEEDGSVRVQSAAACWQSELAVFMGRQNTELQAYMTDWYDAPSTWKRVTKHQGTDDIHGLCFNLVGAMAPDWIPHVFSPESIGGGFTSRVVFVSESRKRQTIADPNKHPPNAKLRDDLIHDLECIHMRVGSYIMTPEARDFYVEWYEKDDEAIQNGIFPIRDTSFHTYCGRRPTLLRKLSMVLAAAERDEFTITLDNIRLALKYMEEVERKLPGTFAAVGRSDNAHAISMVLGLVEARGSIKRSDLLREIYKDVSLEELQQVEGTIEAGKMVKITRLTDDGDTLYEWPT